MRVHRGSLLLAPVAQESIELREGVLVVAAVHLVGDGQVLAGVHVVQGERARLAFGAGALQAIAAEEDEESGDAAAIPQTS